MGLTPEPGSVSLYTGTAAFVTEGFHCVCTLINFLSVYLTNGVCTATTQLTTWITNILFIVCWGLFSQRLTGVKLPIHLFYCHFVYLGNKEIYCTFETYCIYLFYFPQNAMFFKILALSVQKHFS